MTRTGGYESGDGPALLTAPAGPAPGAQSLSGWPVWQVMLAEVVVGMFDGRIATGRRPSRNIIATVGAMPPELVALARQQNATRAARSEHPASGPRFPTTVPAPDGPAGYPGSSRRKRQAEQDAGIR